ncbi:MAG: LCP family protein [Nocardioidaceae bacterium]
MADRPKGDEPDFDWLYGTQGKGVGGSGASTPPSAAGDPEPTQVLPTMSRPHQSPPPPSSGRRGAPQTSRSGSGGRPPGGLATATPPPRRPAAPRRRFRLRWVKYVLLLWLVFLIAVPLFAWSRIHKVGDDPGGSRPADQPGTTYLLVGSDSRAGLTHKQEIALGTGRASGRRTDTIMLLHTGSGPNLLMSIPRDSIVSIPGHGTTKINAAFAYGGPKLLIKTIENTTGIRIDDYVEIGFSGFVNVVDAVGGVRICPKTAMKDKLANLDIKKGCQQVNGKTALGYARSRHTSALGDIDRARHQREVVSAVGHKAASPWSVINPVRYLRLALSGSDALMVGKHTGMLDTLKFAWAMTRVDGKDGLTCGVPIADLGVHWDRQRALKLFNLIQEDKTAQVTKDLCGASGLPGQ